jgi:hypothetical protein
MSASIPGAGLEADFIRCLYQRLSRIGVRYNHPAPWRGQRWGWVWRLSRDVRSRPFWIYALHIKFGNLFMMIVTLNHAVERDTSFEHPLARQKKRLECLS